MDRPGGGDSPETGLCATIERALADDAEVAAAFLFGSHAAGRARPESDVGVGLHRFRVRTYDLHSDLAAVEVLFRRATRERAAAGGAGG